MGVSPRMLAGAIVGLGLTVAILMPSGFVCAERDAIDVRRQWSYFQERWFYGCYPSQPVIDRGIPFMPMDARTDWRTPLRLGAAAAGLLIAWIVIGKSRRPLPNGRGQQPNRRTATVPTSVLVAFSALGGAVIALLLTVRQDPYCILRSRAPGGLSCTYRSFFGWDAEPILVEVLFTVVGAAGGLAVGLLAARHGKLRSRSNEASLASSDPQLPA